MKVIMAEAKLLWLLQPLLREGMGKSQQCTEMHAYTMSAVFWGFFFLVFLKKKLDEFLSIRSYGHVTALYVLIRFQKWVVNRHGVGHGVFLFSLKLSNIYF